jgi:hypothetical protein
MVQAKAELEAAKESTRKQVEIVIAGLAKELEHGARQRKAAVERALAQSKATSRASTARSSSSACWSARCSRTATSTTCS